MGCAYGKQQSNVRAGHDGSFGAGSILPRDFSLELSLRGLVPGASLQGIGSGNAIGHAIFWTLLSIFCRAEVHVSVKTAEKSAWQMSCFHTVQERQYRLNGT